MNAGPSTAQRELVPAVRMSQSRYAMLLAGLLVVVSFALIIFVRPHVGPWLESRSAYRALSSADSDARMEAIRQLRRRDEETESTLITLLHHADPGVRRFAATELAHRTPLTDQIIAAFLLALENNQHVAEIGRSAPSLFFRHAEDANGPLTKTDRRMIAWLRTELNSTNSERSGAAAWALTAFESRDPSLLEPLTAYLKNATFFNKYIVLRQMVDRHPSLRDQYVDLLLSGLASSALNDQRNALYGLTHLKDEPDELRARLETRRAESTDAGEISRIDEVLEKLRNSDVE